MFLTGFREESSQTITADTCRVVTEELANLFKPVCNEVQVRWIFNTHIKNIAEKRSIAKGGPLEPLLLGLELRDALHLDDFFKEKVDPSKTFRDNDIFRVRSTCTERDLLLQIDQPVA